MRVTLVTETYYPQVNGVSRTLGHLVQYLSDSGDTLQIVAPDYGGSPPDDRIWPVQAWKVPFYRELRLPLPPFGKVHRAIDAFRPNLIHIATEATLGLSVLSHARRRGYPVVSSFHTNFDQYASHYSVGWLNGLIRRYLRWFHNRTRETYVPSQSTLETLKAQGFERLVLWSRGVDGCHFRPDRPGRHAVRKALGFGPDHLVIGHVGRIAPEKNIEELGEALFQVEEACPRVRVLIVGDGPSRPALEERLGSSAHCVGYKTGEDLADHYAACDLFAFASRTETFGNVVLEALASGLPVVAIREGGPAETIEHGVTGLLVEPNAPPEAMAKALLQLVRDDATRLAMSQAARAYALSRTWEVVMGKLRKRYAAFDLRGPFSYR